MEARDGLFPHLNDFQMGPSWIPTTPAKPGMTTAQPIYKNWQQNQIVQENQVEKERFSQENQVEWLDFGRLLETPAQRVGPTNSGNFTRSLEGWDPAVIAQSKVYKETVAMYNQFQSKFSFTNLLALARGAGAATAGENMTAQAPADATSSSFVVNCNSRIAGCQEISGSNYQVENRRTTGKPDYGNFSPSVPWFDLNSPPRATDVGSTSISPQFAPITPDPVKRADKGALSDMASLHIEVQENEIIVNRIVTNVLHDKEKSQLVKDQNNATSSDLQENRNPEEGDQNKTPQRKPRRKKHRPKVIIEGQSKRTPKPSTPRPAADEASKKGKRKYVRRKERSKPTSTPSEEGSKKTDPESENSPPGTKDAPKAKRKYVRKKSVKESTEAHSDNDISETVDPPTGQETRKSCRRALKFVNEGNIRNVSSSCGQPSYFNESIAQNIGAQELASTAQQAQGIETANQKTRVGNAHDLTSSVNQVIKGQLMMPEGQYSIPSAQARTSLHHDKSSIDDQKNCTKGKCQIIFSDATRDMDVRSAEVTVNMSSQRASKSPSDSSCSSNACLTEETRARGLKRKMHTSEELQSQNYRSPQDYQAICQSNEHANCLTHTTGTFFPAIYKKKRSEKVEISTASPRCIKPVLENQLKHNTHPLGQTCEMPITTETNHGITHVQSSASNSSTKIPETKYVREEQQNHLSQLISGQLEMRRKRSKGLTRVRDLASLNEIFKQFPALSEGPAASTVTRGFEISHRPYTCMEALVADSRANLTKKKRSKRNLLVGSAAHMHNSHQFAMKFTGPVPAIMWKDIPSVDTIVQQLNSLDINAEDSHHRQKHLITYHMNGQRENALVLYQRDGTIIPFEGLFHQVRRRRPRPKVDLDDETTRVWKLLLEDINSEGIDGVDEEKAKWWEKERQVFTGRANSFIARMRTMQGDRRFSPWKGSVVDSVVGVFLTQNVSDHLSSSAYMSLAARFPLKPKSQICSPFPQTSSTAKRPEIYVLDPDDTIGWHEQSSKQQHCNQVSPIFGDFGCREDVLNSSNFFGNASVCVKSTDCSGQLSNYSKPELYHESTTNCSENQRGGYMVEDLLREFDDAISSQNSVSSSQLSVDSSAVENVDRNESSTQGTLTEAIAKTKHDGLCGSSFVQLLEMADTNLYGVCNQASMDKANQSQFLTSNTHYLYKVQSNEHEANSIPSPASGSSTLNQMTSTREQEARYGNNLKEKRNLPSISNENKSFANNQCGSSADCLSQATYETIADGNFQVPNPLCENMNFIGNHRIQLNQQTGIYSEGTTQQQVHFQESSYSVQQVSKSTHFSGCSMGMMEGTSTTSVSRKPDQKFVEPNLKNCSTQLGSAGDKLNIYQSRERRPRRGKEKQDAVDWGSLRKQAEANHRRERTANTMDSVDWEAVRCADVGEIADTIKERGMNNMLAERIKDFLNRLVSEHGSIDLEWLRDVPPDKAKEYLLSIRGLGLKSVECVRLLTLHHLAFPVDTNVGRIAVRLGWVPLQPLPESLQLHLLELYPVLESIQKYLWPRLCKLDQRTLYELHYHLITFGKVFCTKSKPNCNACPMRGECRHFTSAFASARLALPAPEENSIVCATENGAAHEDPTRTINPLQLALPQEKQQLEAPSEVGNTEPIVEVPQTPEPIIEVPATPEMERTHVAESDIEDVLVEDPDEIPTIKLNMVEFTENVKEFVKNNMELQPSEMSKAIVALTSAAASIPMHKLKNISRLRTEHQVYELPDSHPLVEGLDRREPDDPSPYLLAIWTPGETPDSIQPPESRCSSQMSSRLCDAETCFSCNSIREANSQTVRGTLLIPCRTAMRGSFPLNGTYFQVNEVFADHKSSINPIAVPRDWLWNLRRRTVYFGTSIPTIFKGQSTENIQQCFWRGFVCVRGFDLETRAPRPLIARLHFPASRLARNRGRMDEN